MLNYDDFHHTLTNNFMFLDVVLPLPLRQPYTYIVTKEESKIIKPGTRVIVPFGKRKKYTAVSLLVHNNCPQAYEPKQIEGILDESPILTPIQISFLKWISDYYITPLGIVLKAALPSTMFLQSETEVTVNKYLNSNNILSKKAKQILYSLKPGETYSIKALQKNYSSKNIFPVIKELNEKNFLIISEEIYEKYKSKKIYVLSLNKKIKSVDKVLISLKNKHHQYLTLSNFLKETNPVMLSKFKKLKDVSESSISTLIKKEILVKNTLDIERVSAKKTSDIKVYSLSVEQNNAYKSIKNHWKNKNVVLLHGVTGSGKTEIYMKLIKDVIKSGKQVLYLVPEISLTTQLTSRLRKFFGTTMAVYHSRYTKNERTEIWYKVISNDTKTKLVVGARSAVFLPFVKLGLVIVDEPHERSYKQYDAAPRYNARDCAIFLSKLNGSKVLLGTATPNVESYLNAENEKYGLTTLSKRYQNAKLPDISFVNLKTAYKNQQMHGFLSYELINSIEFALNKSKQIILFQNRRGYSSYVECNNCGSVPKCDRCDVSFTYHSENNQLKCHYCGNNKKFNNICEACGSIGQSNHGLGTQQLEEEIKILFPKAKVKRMDLDTTRNKNSHQNIINSFAQKKVDILIGTQMIAKGLDFNNVTLVGVISADSFLNFPDFRSNERTFQILTQVSGRAGRNGDASKVLIQTFNPSHTVLKNIGDNDYLSFYENEINQRKQFFYPPYSRLIKIELKCKNMSTLSDASKWIKKGIDQRFTHVLGPVSPIVPRIRSFYLMNIIIKVSPKKSLKKSKFILLDLIKSFEKISIFKPVIINIDIDPN